MENFHAQIVNNEKGRRERALNEINNQQYIYHQVLR